MRGKWKRRSAGFTFIELLVVLSIMTVLAFIGFSALANTVYRAKLVTSAEQTATFIRLARLSAIKRGQTVYLRILTSATSEGGKDEVFVFADTDSNGAYDVTIDGAKLASFTLPNGVLLAGPGPATDGNATAVDRVPTASGVYSVRFLIDGSADLGGTPTPNTEGAIRFRDTHNNILETRIAPLQVARVVTRKYFGDPTAADDLTQYFKNGESGNVWNWL